MNDGTFSSAEWVKVEGGCSAPSAGSDGESVDLGKIRVRVDDIRIMRTLAYWGSD